MAEIRGIRDTGHRRAWAWMAVMGLLAFVIGTLFRLADQTGVALLRMAGTISMVLAGLAGTQGIRAMYEADGRQQVREALARHAAGIVVQGVRQRGLRADFVWVGPRGVTLLYLVHSTPGRKALPAALVRWRRQAEQQLGLLQHDLGKWGRLRALGNSGQQPPEQQAPEGEVPVRAWVVTTRLQLPPETAEHQIPAVDPDGLVRLLQNEQPAVSPEDSGGPK